MKQGLEGIRLCWFSLKILLSLNTMGWKKEHDHLWILKVGDLTAEVEYDGEWSVLVYRNINDRSLYNRGFEWHREARRHAEKLLTFMNHLLNT